MLANNVVLFAHLYNMLVMHKHVGQQCINMLANNVLLFAHLYNMLANNVLLFGHLYNLLACKNVGQQCSAVWTSLQLVSDA